MPVDDVGVGPGNEVARRLVEALPECLALADVGAVAVEHLRVADHPRALGLGDRARVILRIGVDHQQLVDERHLLHQLAPRGTHDRADRRRLVERRQDRADRDALLLLERHEHAQVAELAVVEVRLGEPAIDAGGRAAALLGRAVGRLERLGLLGALIEGRAGDRLACLDHDDRRLGMLGDGLGQDAEERAVGVGHVGRRHRRGAHDHQLRRIRPP